jgi:hypothetical protein
MDRPFQASSGTLRSTGSQPGPVDLVALVLTTWVPVDADASTVQVALWTSAMGPVPTSSLDLPVAGTETASLVTRDPPSGAPTDPMA